MWVLVVGLGRRVLMVSEAKIIHPTCSLPYMIFVAALLLVGWSEAALLIDFKFA